MRIEDLWQLYEEVAKALADKIAAEKHGLESRLAKSTPFQAVRRARANAPPSLSLMDREARRKYPRIESDRSRNRKK